MVDLLITHGFLVTPTQDDVRVIKDGAVAIQKDKIVEIGTTEELKKKYKPGSIDRSLDAKDHIILPGLVNSHIHASRTINRGLGEDRPPDEWMYKFVWGMMDSYTPETVYWAALMCFLDCVKSGTTTAAVMDFYCDDVAKAAKDIGIRSVIGLFTFEETGPPKFTGKDQVRECIRFAMESLKQRDELVTPCLAAHAPDTVSVESLKKMKELSDKHDLRLQVHLAQQRKEVRVVKEKYGKEPVEHLQANGILGPRTVAAHCLYINDDQAGILAESGTHVAYDGKTTAKRQGAIYPFNPELKRRGANVAIGTGSALSVDMFDEMRFASILQKLRLGDPTFLSPFDVLRMATINGARAFGLDVGSLQPGNKADIILVNMRRPSMVPMHNVVSNIVNCGTGADVDTVLINGKIIMKDRVLLPLDEESCMEEFRSIDRDYIASIEAKHPDLKALLDDELRFSAY